MAAKKIGTFWVPARLDMSQLIKEMRQDLPREAKQGGQKTAKELLDSLRSEFQKKTGAAREALMRGLIDRAEFKKISQNAAKEFNAGILPALKEMRREGKQNTEEYARLSRALKTVAQDGRRAVRDTETGFRGLLGIVTSVRNVVGTVVAFLAARGVFGFLGGAASAATDVARSFLRLSASAKLYGVDQKQLNDLAAAGRRELHLTAGVANNLAATTSKFAALAGDAAQAQELLNRALDLGAAQGMVAAEVNEALEQTLRGQDEGLDKLLAKNPSAVYAEYAAAAGKSAAKLTETEKKQALLNAIVEAGRKVQGEYSRQLETDIGKLTKFQQAVQAGREEIGASLIPILVKLTEVLEGPLAAATRSIVNLFESMMDPVDRVILRMQRLGVAVETMMPMVLRRQIAEGQQTAKDLEKEIEGLKRDWRDTRGLSSGEIRALRDRTAAALATDTDPRRAASRASLLEHLNLIIAKEQELADVRKQIADAERQVPDADRRARLRAEVDEITRQINDLQHQADSAARDATIRQLEARRKAIEETLNPAKTAEEEPAEKTDPEAAKQLAKERAEILEEFRVAAAEATATLVDDMTIQLERLEAEVREKFGARLPAEVEAGLAAAREKIDQQRRIEQVERDLSGVMAPEDARALEDYIAQLLAERDALEEGSVARERMNALIGKASQRYQQLKKDAQEATDAEEEGAKKSEEERIRRLRDQAHTIEENARAALQLADAFGLIDAEAARAFESMVQFGTSLARVLGGDLSAIPSLLGSVASLGQAFTGEDEAAKAHRTALEQNTQRLRELALAIEGFRGTADNLSEAGRILSTLTEQDIQILNAAQHGDALDGQIKMANAVIARLVAQGLRVSEIDALAKEAGITVRGKDGRFIGTALEQLAEWINKTKAALIGFSDALIDEQRRALELEDEIFDRDDDPGAALQREVALLEKFAPTLAKAFGISGLNPATAEGRAALEEAIRAIFVAFRDKTLDPALLGGLTRDEFLQLIQAIEQGLDATAGGVTAEGQPETRLGVSITAVQADAWIAIGSSQLYELRAIRSLLAGSGLPTPAAVPTIAAPSPAALGLHGGSTTINVHMGAPSVEINLGGGPGGLDRADLVDAGRAAGAALGDAFAERIGAAYRGRGATGPARVHVDTRMV